MKSNFYKVVVGSDTRLVHAGSKRIAEEFVIGSVVQAVKLDLSGVAHLARTLPIEYAHDGQSAQEAAAELDDFPVIKAVKEVS